MLFILKVLVGVRWNPISLVKFTLAPFPSVVRPDHRFIIFILSGDRLELLMDNLFTRVKSLLNLKVPAILSSAAARCWLLG